MKKRIIVPFCFIFAATVLIAFQQAEAALSGAEEQIRELEDLWSVTEGQSEIYRLNHHQGNCMTVSSETTDLISYALGMAEQTDGSLWRVGLRDPFGRKNTLLLP